MFELLLIERQPGMVSPHNLNRLSNFTIHLIGMNVFIASLLLETIIMLLPFIVALANKPTHTCFETTLATTKILKNHRLNCCKQTRRQINEISRVWNALIELKYPLLHSTKKGTAAGLLILRRYDPFVRVFSHAEEERDIIEVTELSSS